MLTSHSLRRIELLLTGVSCMVLSLIVVMALRPDGAVGYRISQWRVSIRDRQRIAANWQALLSSGNRLDSTHVVPRLVEFADYECPYCKRAHYAIKELLREHAELAVVYRNLPLPIHPAARGAARASVCAAAQGRFLEMHDRLFETNAWQDDTSWAREALAAGVGDSAEFRRCLHRASTDEVLRRDSALAATLGVTATPTFFTQRGRWSGSLTNADLVRLLGTR